MIFAIPIVLTNLVQQLYSMVDLAVIGQCVGTLGTIGVNTGGEIADLVAPIAMGFSTAGQIYISQLYGAREEGKIKKTVGTLLSFMILISIVLAIVAIFFHTPILNLIQPSERGDGSGEAHSGGDHGDHRLSSGCARLRNPAGDGGIQASADLYSCGGGD